MVIIVGWISCVLNLIYNQIYGLSDYNSNWGYIFGATIVLVGLTESNFKLKKRLKILETKTNTRLTESINKNSL